ncbi:MAG: hypothetical protein QM676_07435, partial [Novosphingobium sp.]
MFGRGVSAALKPFSPHTWLTNIIMADRVIGPFFRAVLTLIRGQETKGTISMVHAATRISTF